MPRRHAQDFRRFLTPVLSALLVAAASFPLALAAEGFKTHDEIVRALIGGASGGAPAAADAAAADTGEAPLVFRSLRRVPARAPAAPESAAATAPAQPAAPAVNAAVPAERRIDLTILFARDSDSIAIQSRQQIAEIAMAAPQLDLGQNQLLIIGHTDTDGPDWYNLDLSRRRAQAVRSALIRDHALPADALLAQGKGETEPLVSPEQTPDDRARNRRVELRLVARPPAAP